MGIIVLFKTILFLSTIFWCGFIITKRVCQDKRAQLIIPTALIVGTSAFVFLLNAVAFFVKGTSGILLAFVLLILFSIFLKFKIKAEKLVFPQGMQKIVWVVSLVIWFLFLYQITATGHAFSGDWQNHTTLAALFSRGDFPIHSPFQPNRLSSYHVAVAELLGATKTLIPSPYAFVPTLFSFIFLFSISQILQWIIKVPQRLGYLMLLILIPLVAIISFGNFTIVWPYTFSLPKIETNIIDWLGKLPGLYSAFDGFGSATSLDALQLFLHRTFSIAIVAALFSLILYPNKNKQILSAGMVAVLIATLALADEAVFIIVTPAIVGVTFLTLFSRNLRNWLILSVCLIFVTVFQGGLINEVLFNSNQTIAKVLFYPDDQTGSTSRFEKYRTHRLEQQKSTLYEDKDEYKPFKWFHAGILWQLFGSFTVGLLFCLTLGKKLEDKTGTYLIWLFFISSVLSFAAYHIIVPEGMYHINGNRFLALSYQLSGVSLIITIILCWINIKVSRFKFFAILTKGLIIWVLLTSIIPPLAHVFPRQKYNWFSLEKVTVKPEIKWMQDNLKFNNKILIFTEKSPSSGPILETVREVGIYTPVWLDKPESQGFEVSPPYLDLFYTLNPALLGELGVEYLMVNNEYLATLPKERFDDLNNENYFQVVYKDKDVNFKILKINSEFFEKAENYPGTFYELTKKLPTSGSFYIETPPKIDETVWRVSFLTLQMQNYQMYYSSKFIPFYNFIINVKLKHDGELKDNYDYLMLGGQSDPKQICHCNPVLIWSNISGKVKLWKVS